MMNHFFKFVLPSRLHAAGVLGMNSRNYKFISRYNQRRLYPLVDDKVQTKTLAQKHGITTPGLIGVIEYQYQVKDILFDQFKEHPITFNDMIGKHMVKEVVKSVVTGILRGFPRMERPVDVVYQKICRYYLQIFHFPDTRCCQS